MICWSKSSRGVAVRARNRAAKPRDGKVTFLSPLHQTSSRRIALLFLAARARGSKVCSQTNLWFTSTRFPSLKNEKKIGAYIGAENVFIVSWKPLFYFLTNPSWFYILLLMANYTQSGGYLPLSEAIIKRYLPSLGWIIGLVYTTQAE